MIKQLASLVIICVCCAAFAEPASQPTDSPNPPAIPGCSFSKNNDLTGFFEYNCEQAAKITGVSEGGKCQSGSLDMDNKTYYCLSAEASSNIRVMLKCPGGWNPDPQHQGGFICGNAKQNNNQDL